MLEGVSFSRRLILLLSALAMFFLVLQEHLLKLPLNAALLLAGSVIIYLLLSYKVIISAYKTLVRGHRLSEEFLMVTATLGAFGIGDYAEALAVMLFYQIGALFEDYAGRRSRREISALASLKPQKVRVVDAQGSESFKKPREVRVGELIKLLPGEMLSLDAALQGAQAAFDTAALTGESEPRLYGKGAEVPAGVICCGSPVILQAQKLYRDSSLVRLMNLIEDAQERKSTPESLISRFARWYTPLVVGAAVLLALTPLWLEGAQWSDWVTRALVFLVVSCPCALVLSVPLTFYGGLGALSRIGVMVKGTVFIETMARLQAIAFDKTGTLTTGSFDLQKITTFGEISEDEALGVAAALEHESNHPLAQALVRAAVQRGLTLPALADYQEYPGRGVTASLQGIKYACGRRNFVSELTAASADGHDAAAAPEGNVALSEVCLGREGQIIAVLALGDALRPEAQSTLAALKRLGLVSCLISGDKQASAQRVAAMLHLNKVFAEQLPEHKLESLKSFRQSEGRCAYVGDGLNDAPVLAAADVGFSLGQFAQAAAVEAADVVIMDDKLDKIPKALGLTRRIYKLALQNMWFVIAVKLGILLLGAVGLAGIWLAIFGDVGVLILAVLNAMRTLRFKPEPEAAAGGPVAVSAPPAAAA